MKLLQKKIVALSRVFCTVMLLIWWYSFGKILWKPSIVFQVYGTEKDKRSYFTPWMEKILPISFPIALLRVGKKWGIVAGTMITDEEFEQVPLRAIELMKEANRQFASAKSIALAGRIPSHIRRAGGTIQTPSVDGSLGTRYAMQKCASALAEQTVGKRDFRTMTLSIIGAGFIGRQVAQDLSEEFGKIIVCDPKYETTIIKRNLIFTNQQSQVSAAKLHFVFTPKGNDVQEYIRFFKRDSIVGDDTHPCMKSATRELIQNRNAKLYKLVTECETGVSIFPRLPNFASSNVPGCLVEAIVVERFGREKTLELGYKAFSECANECGIEPRLMKHSNDS